MTLEKPDTETESKIEQTPEDNLEKVSLFKRLRELFVQASEKELAEASSMELAEVLDNILGDLPNELQESLKTEAKEYQDLGADNPKIFEKIKRRHP